MNRSLSASILKCRPSVIKWVGKDTTDTNCNDRKADISFISRSIGQPCTRSTQGLCEQGTGSVSDESKSNYHNHNAAINNESMFSELENEEKRYVCMICKRSFKWRSHWKSHERIHSGERPFKCEICDKAFTRSDGLQSHKKVHIKIKNTFCTEAEVNYFLGNDVRRDVSDVKQEKLFICGYCGRSLVSFAGYCRHTDGHKGKEEDLKCHICNIIFNRPSALEIHNRVHTGLKPYRCNVCSKAFSVRGNLKRHLFIHTGEKPYKCIYCSSSFNNSSHLARHAKSKHQKHSLYKPQ